MRHCSKIFLEKRAISNWNVVDITSPRVQRGKRRSAGTPVGRLTQLDNGATFPADEMFVLDPKHSSVKFVYCSVCRRVAPAEMVVGRYPRLKQKKLQIKKFGFENAFIFINQSIDQSTNQSTNQPINRSINRPISQSKTWSINQSINRNAHG